VIVDTDSAGRIGLLVDDLVGQQQVVVKSIEANYGHIPGIGGATILGSGRVALILDVAGLAAAAGARPCSARAMGAAQPATLN
jgi:two-component system chemotaxis sensor kinase CheA